MPEASTSAGRGVLYISFAKLYFMAAGYVIYFLLPRLLHSDAAFGDYVLVIGLVSVIDNVIVTGTIQGVSKFTAEDETRAEAVKAAALKVLLLLGGGVAALYALAAPLIARWENDPGLTGLFRLSAGIVFCYALYAVFVGSCNGRRMFARQASLDVGFATLRMAFICGFALLGWGVWGAVGGFVAAAGSFLVLAAGWVGLPRTQERFPPGRFVGYLVQLFLYTAALNLTMRVDLFMLKRYVGAWAAGQGLADPAKVASAFTGYYGAAQTLAFIPYQAILAVAFVIFPLVSRSTFEQDVEKTRSYVRQTLRLSLVFCAGLGVVFMANPEAVINVPYKAVYRQAGLGLGLLAAGMVCFSMFTIVNTILNGAGKTGAALLSGVVTLVAAAAANWALVPRAASAREALALAAGASAGAMALGAVLSAALLYRAFKAGIPWLTFLRVLAATAVGLGVGRLIPEVSKLVTIGECLAVFAAYLATLVLLRELGSEELARVRKILRRGG